MALLACNPSLHLNEACITGIYAQKNERIYFTTIIFVLNSAWCCLSSVQYFRNISNRFHLRSLMQETNFSLLPFKPNFKKTLAGYHVISLSNNSKLTQFLSIRFYFRFLFSLFVQLI